ncbi:uncharacterized protein LOC144602578 [Rhinoraja longicauda]
MRGGGYIFALLLVRAVMMDEFLVIVPDYPVLVTVGEDALLECQKVPDTSLDVLEVRWFTTSPGSPVHLYTGGQDRPEVQDGAYRGRTELIREEFRRGNASLKLKRAKVSDAGNYTCSISSPTSRQQAALRLQVEGFGLRPWIRLEESTKQGVRVVCTSDRWFPEPDIRWRDGSGQDVTALSDTRFTADSSGLVTVRSHIDVTSDSVNRYSCFMRSKRLGKTREAHLQISDMFIIKANEFNIWLPIFWVLAGLVVTAAAFNIMFHRKEDRKIQELQLFFTLEGLDDIAIEYVSVTLDVETAHPRLEVSEDRKRMRWTRTERILPDTGKRFTYWSSLMGSEGFISGRRYWEVEVAASRGWCLGVAAESVERKEALKLRPEHGLWSLERLGDRFYVNTLPESDLPAGPIPRRVGVYLSYESGTVSFYDADTKSHLHTFTGNKFTEKLYPFFATWDTKLALRICPSSTLRLCDVEGGDRGVGVTLLLTAATSEDSQEGLEEFTESDNIPVEHGYRDWVIVKPRCPGPAHCPRGAAQAETSVGCRGRSGESGRSEERRERDPETQGADSKGSRGLGAGTGVLWPPVVLGHPAQGVTFQPPVSSTDPSTGMGLFHCAVLLLHGILTSVHGEFAVIVPGDGGFAATVGGDAVLECQLVPDILTSDMEVQWRKSGLASPVLVYRHGQSDALAQHQDYRARAQLFKDELAKGNISLRIMNVRRLDEGEYTCSVTDRTENEASPAQLRVQGLGSKPRIQLLGYQGDGIQLVCKSGGWYPGPEMVWNGEDGQVLPQAETRYHEDTEGLINVESNVTVTRQSTNKFKCVVRYRWLNIRHEAIVKISDEIFPAGVPDWVLPLVLTICLLIAANGAVFLWNVKQNRRIKELERRKSIVEHGQWTPLVQSEWKRILGHQVSVTLDAETAHAQLEVSEDRKRVRRTGTERSLPDTGKRFTDWPCVLGSEGFTSGRHYWEVEVGGCRYWGLGVAAESVEREGEVTKTPETGVWSIERLDDEFHARTSPPSPLPARPIPGRVGVYLSYQSGAVSFYDAATKSHLHTFTGNKFMEKCYPFFWTLDDEWLRICSGSAPGV